MHTRAARIERIIPVPSAQAYVIRDREFGVITVRVPNDMTWDTSYVIAQAQRAMPDSEEGAPVWFSWSALKSEAEKMEPGVGLFMPSSLRQNWGTRLLDPEESYLEFILHSDLDARKATSSQVHKLVAPQLFRYKGQGKPLKELHVALGDPRSSRIERNAKDLREAHERLSREVHSGPPGVPPNALGPDATSITPSRQLGRGMPDSGGGVSGEITIGQRERLTALLQQYSRDAIASVEREKQDDRASPVFPGTADYVVPTITCRHRHVYDAGNDSVLIQPGGRFVLSSNSGTGKTTFLREYFLERATAFLANSEREILPFLIRLPEIVDFPEDDLAELLTTLVLNSRSDWSDVYGPGLRNEVRRHIQSGEVLLLLDGLDQMPSTADQSSTRPKLFGSRAGIRAHPRWRVIVASRPPAVLKYRDELAGYSAIDIRPFDARQIRDYFRGVRTPDGEALDKTVIARLLQDMFELSQTPILMALIGQIAQMSDLAKIRRRSDVYECFVDQIVEHNVERENARAPDRPEIDKLRIVDQLKAVALLGLVAGDICQITEKTVAGQIINKVEGLCSLPALHRLCKFGVTHRILARPSLDARATIEFKHQSFQAYFAALALLDSARSGKSIEGIAKGKDAPHWLETFAFLGDFRELPDSDRLVLVNCFCEAYRSQQHDEWLYEAARVCSALPQDDGRPLRKWIGQELVAKVSVGPDEVVASEKPFAALRDIGELDFMSAYIGDQAGRNAVNRFHAFKYACTTLGRDLAEEDSEKIVRQIEKMARSRPYGKLDLLFALHRIESKSCPDLLTDFWLDLFQRVDPRIFGILRRCAELLPGKLAVRDWIYENWISKGRSAARASTFFSSANALYGHRRSKSVVRRGLRPVLRYFETRLYEHVAGGKRIVKVLGSKWELHEDVSLYLLGLLANEKLVWPFYESHLQPAATTHDEKYQQAVAAMALASCYPQNMVDHGCLTEERDRRANLIANRCIEIFASDPVNPFRYYLAGALTLLGTESVIDYFLGYIRCRGDNQRWYCTVVLGAQKAPYVLEKLGEIHRDDKTDEETRSLINQTFLVYSQTFA